MMRRQSIILLVAIFAISVSAINAHSAAPLRLKTLKGTWTCPTCEAEGLKGDYETCEALGHEHALKLMDGSYVYYAHNVRAEALIKGGGRHSGVKITVAGFYDPSTKTIDVDAYQIDGLWTSWCVNDQRMDFCRAMAFAGAQEAENRQGK